MLTVLDLFSGIGGFALGLESTGGFRTVAFCEIEPFPRAVLAHYWPSVPIHEDVRGLRGETVGPVDMICGGFPCQDISVAGKGAGLHGSRSGLWFEAARLVGELGPGWCLFENVGALRTRGIDRVCSDLEAEGYAVWPLVVGAWAVGAPHRRERVWIVGHRAGSRRECGDAVGCERSQEGIARLAAGCASELSNSDAGRREREGQSVQAGRDEPECSTAVGLADRDGERLGCLGSGGLLDGERAASGDDADGRSKWPVGSPTGAGLADGRLGTESARAQEPEHSRAGGSVGDAECGFGEGARDRKNNRRSAGDREAGVTRVTSHVPARWPARPGEPQHEWEPARLAEFQVGCGLDGLPERLARRANRESLKALGNSVVPQVVACIGRAILAAEAEVGGGGGSAG